MGLQSKAFTKGVKFKRRDFNAVSGIFIVSPSEAALISWELVKWLLLRVSTVSSKQGSPLNWNPNVNKWYTEVQRKLPPATCREMEAPSSQHSHCTTDSTVDSGAGSGTQQLMPRLQQPCERDAHQAQHSTHPWKHLHSGEGPSGRNHD